MKPPERHAIIIGNTLKRSAVLNEAEAMRQCIQAKKDRDEHKALQEWIASGGAKKAAAKFAKKQ